MQLELEGFNLEEKEMVTDTEFLSTIMDLNEKLFDCQDIKLLDDIESELKGNF